jgi:hypothetical protein
VTEAQVCRHWRDWNRVAVANGWVMRKGRLVALGEESESGPADAGPHSKSEQHAKVWVFAEQLAARGHRAVTADDLRHACYLAAFGRAASMKSSDPMNNGEFNRLLALFEILIEPDNLRAQVNWMHPEEAARRGLVASILRNAPGEAYVIAIAKRKFGTAAWRDLGDRQLRQLTITLKERTRKKERELTTVGDPF